MKNKNGFYIGAIVTLSIILVGIIAFIIVNNKEVKLENNDDNKEEEVSFYNYDSKIDKKIIEVAKKFDKKYDTYQLTNLNKLTNNISEFNTLENNQKLDLIGAYFDHYRDVEGYDGKVIDDNPTSLDFKEYLKDVFKDDITFTDDNLLCDEVGSYHCHVLFNKDKNYYEYNDKVSNHESDKSIEYYSKLVDALNEENIYVLTYVKVFSKDGDSFYDEYNIKDNSNKIVEAPNTVSGFDPTKLISDSFNKIKDYSKYKKYIYTIELIDDDVYLRSYNFSE